MATDPDLASLDTMGGAAPDVPPEERVDGAEIRPRQVRRLIDKSALSSDDTTARQLDQWMTLWMASPISTLSRPVGQGFVEACWATLETHRILIVAGDQHLTFSALHAIVNQKCAENMDRLKIRSERFPEHQEQLYEMLLESERSDWRDQPAITRDQLIVVDATHVNAQLFVGHLVTWSVSMLDDLQFRARSTRRYLLVGLPEHTSTESIARFEKLGMYLRVPASSTAPPRTPESAAPEMGSILWRWTADRSLMDRMVLFVAAFFPSLAADQFERIVLLLLSDRRETGAPAAEAPAGGAPAGGAPAEARALTEVWFAERASILERCGLSYLPGEGDATVRCVGLPHPGAVESLEAEILQRDYLFYMEQVCRLEEAGLLFASPQETFDQVVRLFADAAAQSPGTRGAAILWGLVRAIAAALGQPEARDLRPDVVEMLRRSVQAHVFDRIAWFLGALRARPGLEEVERDLLNQLMKLQWYKAVLELVRRLRGVGRFDELLWLRRLLNNGDGEARGETYRELAGRLRRDGARARATVVVLCDWVAENGASGDQAGRAAADLVVRLCEEGLTAPDTSSHGVVRAALHASREGEVLSRLVKAHSGGRVDARLRERISHHFGVLEGYRLVPPQMSAQLDDGGEALAGQIARRCRAAVRSARAAAGGDAWPGEGLFQALCWADWAARALHPAGGQTEITACANLVAAGLEELSRGRRGVRDAFLEYWYAMDEGLGLSLGAVSTLRVPREIGGDMRSRIRSLLDDRRRAVTELRRCASNERARQRAR